MPTQAEIEAAARALCVLDGHNPDAIGAAPSKDGSAIPDHAFPRWGDWVDAARAALEATERVRQKNQG